MENQGHSFSEITGKLPPNHRRNQDRVESYGEVRSVLLLNRELHPSHRWLWLWHNPCCSSSRAQPDLCSQAAAGFPISSFQNKESGPAANALTYPDWVTILAQVVIKTSSYSISKDKSDINVSPTTTAFNGTGLFCFYFLLLKCFYCPSVGNYYRAARAWYN